MKVTELIEKLRSLENQDAAIHVEAPLYDADNNTPYAWPTCDFSIEIWDMENEWESDGETILLKSCIKDNKISITPHQLLSRAANNLGDWLRLVDGVNPDGVEYAMYKSLINQIAKSLD